jgi:hypothetical protein
VSTSSRESPAVARGNAEDDDLITSIGVTTDRLLAASTPTHVKLIIKVHVQNLSTFGGLVVLG